MGKVTAASQTVHARCAGKQSTTPQHAAGRPSELKSSYLSKSIMEISVGFLWTLASSAANNAALKSQAINVQHARQRRQRSTHKEQIGDYNPVCPRRAHQHMTTIEHNH
jgi:hypothetical protein